MVDLLSFARELEAQTDLMVRTPFVVWADKQASTVSGKAKQQISSPLNSKSCRILQFDATHN